MRLLCLVALLFVWSFGMAVAVRAMNLPSDLAFYGGVLFAFALTVIALRAFTYFVRRLF